MNLDDLNDKLKVKEFKATIKDIKSKEHTIRSIAVGKLKDARYITQGGCLPSLLESLVPKKKSFDTSLISINGLISFLETAETHVLLSALDTLVLPTGDLNGLNFLSDILIFKEEIKIPKPKKGGNANEEVIIPENELVISIRLGAMKAIFEISTHILNYQNTSEDNHSHYQSLGKSFASLPSLFENVLKAIDTCHQNLVPITSSQAAKESQLQYAFWSLSSLFQFLSFNPTCITKLCESSTLKIISSLAKEDMLTTACLKIFKVLSTSEVGVTVISGDETQTMQCFIDILVSSTDRLHEAAAAAIAATAAASGTKGKEVKKEVVKKDDKSKAKTVAVDHESNVDENANHKTVIEDPNTLAVTYINLICHILFAVSLKQESSSVMTEEYIQKITSILAGACKNAILWSIAQAHGTNPTDATVVDLTSTVEICCSLIGSFGNISDDIRRSACSAGGLIALIQALKDSSIICAQPNANMQANTPRNNDHAGTDELTLLSLRSTLEKGILSLACSKISKSPNQTSEKSSKWKSTEQYSTDVTTLQEAPSSDFAGMLFALLAELQDIDLNSRVIRILSSILLSSSSSDSSSVEFARILKIDASVTSKISHLFSLYSSEYLKTLITPVSTSAVEDVISEISPSEVVAVLDKTGNRTLTLNSLSPNWKERCFLVLALLEICVQISPENINAFSTVEICKVMGQLLYISGPTSSARETIEIEVNLYDLRSYEWSFSQTLNASAAFDVVNIRPIILDLIALVAAADNQYRNFEGVLPVEPGKPLPVTTSRCNQAAMSVCRYCSDAAFSILLACTNYITAPGGEYLAIEIPTTINLQQNVLDASLRSICAIASCGVVGLYGVLESIAEVGYESHGADGGNSICKPAMNNLLSYFESTRIGVEDIFGKFVWTRSSHFDSLITTVPSEISNLLSKKIIWPYFTVCSAILGVLADFRLHSDSIALALRAMQLMTKSNLFSDVAQPVVMDIFSAAYLSLGALPKLIGCFGKFGSLSEDLKISEIHFLNYIVDRGHVRQVFWDEWAETHKEIIAIDPKTGKPIPPPKDKAKAAKEKPEVKKKDPKAVVEAPPIIEEASYNIEPDDTNPDPNHGPNFDLWKKLVNVKSSDNHTRFAIDYLETTSLNSSIQGSLDAVTQNIITRGAEVNAPDAYGNVPLMYALLFSNEFSFHYLLENKANVDAVDAIGNPVVKYAFMSLNNQEIYSTLLECRKSKRVDKERFTTKATAVKVLGETFLLLALLKTAIDVNVSDPAGNFPLHYCVGLCTAIIKVGGFDLDITNGAYTGYYPSTQVLTDIQIVASKMNDVNVCNFNGTSPMHIIGGRGDIESLKFLIDNGAAPNVLDNRWYLPLHYLVAACPSNAIECFDFMMAKGCHRPIEPLKVPEIRTGKSSDEKFEMDLKNTLDDFFLEALSPTIISKSRCEYEDLLLCRTNDDLSVLHLALSSAFLGDPNLQKYISGGKYERLALALHIIAKGKSVLPTLISFVDVNNMSLLHAASLALEGISPQIELSHREKYSPAYKKYASSELHLLDVIYSAGSGGLIDINAVCSRAINISKFPGQWTALHGAIKCGNHELCSSLLQHGIKIVGFPYIHFLADCCNDMITSEIIIAAVTSASTNSPRAPPLSLVNTKPLHSAVRNKNIAVIKALVKCFKFDVNSIDENTGKTAIHEACDSGDISLLAAFSDCSDRLDFLKRDNDGISCIEAVVNTGNVDMLVKLLAMRKNDVIECLLRERDGKERNSILMDLELENMKLAKCLFKPQNISQEGNDDKNSQSFYDNVNVDYAVKDDNNDIIENFEKMEISENISDENKFGKDGTKSVGVPVPADGDSGGVRVSEEEETYNTKLLEKSNDLLNAVLPHINDNGLISVSFHAHECFFNGVLYHQFLLQK